MTELTGRAVSYLRLSKDDVSKSKIKKYESLKVESFGDFLYNRKEY